MTKNIFSGKLKLADLLQFNLSLAIIVNRFGIPLGFGDKTVEQVCRHYQISTNFFLLVCNVYTFKNYLPSEEEILLSDVENLIPFLQKSHQYYLTERIPHIERHLQKICKTANNKADEIAVRFFNEYKKEVVSHFDYEDQEVFPYINELINHHRKGDFCISQFEKNHSNIDDKLDDLTNIIIKYLPGETLAGERLSLLLDLHHLSFDFKRHTLMEEKILVPYVKQLENNES